MAKKTPSTSSVGRSIKLGGLVGRVGASMLGRRLTDIGRSDDERRQREARNLIRNAHRVVATLGEMKGAAMKVGQMLSLQEGLLPPEVAEVLAGLQQQAPKVPSEVMRFEVEGALGDVDAHFAHLDQEAFAAASIGQVHRGRLHDGREVAVKIQYPLIDQIVRADLKSLKHLVGSLVAMVSEVDFEPIWAEVRDRLVEELDYSVEATSMREMAELERDVPSIVIPDVVPELTTANVLTMIFEPAMGADEACSDAFDQDLRNRWGAELFDFHLRGLLRHGVLHADPNLANFGFREDGSLVVYDFGCVKRLPADLVAGYRRLFSVVSTRQWGEVPEILREMGVRRRDGSAIAAELTDPYAEILSRVVDSDPPYTFGDDDMPIELMELGMEQIPETADLDFPSDIIFVNRTFGGHLGNLGRLRATADWREMILRYCTDTE
jgi:predicted unusual protein kinase regulating ubiquinone biosynthesis (AarF/ABC1/UbiB family)